MRISALILSTAITVVGISTASATEITGAGSSFAYPIFSKWASTYEHQKGVRINYQSVGSGAGIKQITSKTVDFGASDMPLKKSDLESKGLTQFPAIMGGVVMVVNLKGIGPGELKLTGDLVADIYLGKIKNWNDPAIAKVNQGVKLPDENITIVRRADGSGTTFIFTNYLSKISKQWAEEVGNSTAVKWPEGVAGKGNAGVASYVQRINGAIGYVEYAYAKSSNMTFTQLQNKEGHFVSPKIDTFQSAAAYADWTHAEDFYEVLTNEPGKDSWPITGATFVLM